LFSPVWFLIQATNATFSPPPAHLPGTSLQILRLLLLAGKEARRVQITACATRPPGSPARLA